MKTDIRKIEEPDPEGESNGRIGRIQVDASAASYDGPCVALLRRLLVGGRGGIR